MSNASLVNIIASINCAIITVNINVANCINKINAMPPTVFVANIVFLLSGIEPIKSTLVLLYTYPNKDNDSKNGSMYVRKIFIAPKGINEYTSIEVLFISCKTVNIGINTSIKRIIPFDFFTFSLKYLKLNNLVKFIS